MHVNQLRYFLEVARQGSFSKASAALSVAQSAVSRQISNLEGELGVRLLYRDGRGAQLTDEGRHFMAHCINALEELDLAKRAMTRFANHPTGSVIFCMPPTITYLFASTVVTRFHEAYPDVCLRLVEVISGHVQEWLMDNRVDAGILYQGRSMFNYPTEPLFEEDLFLIWSPNMTTHSWSPRDTVPFGAACELPLILPGPTDGVRRSVEAVAQEQECKPHVEMEIDALGTIKDLVHTGRWYAIQPASAVKKEIANGTIRAARIVKPAVTRRMVLGYANNRPLTPAAREFVRILKAELQVIARDCPSIRTFAIPDLTAAPARHKSSTPVD